MCHMKVDVAFFEYFELVYITLLLILYSLIIVSIFVLHICCFGYVYLELRFYEYIC